MKKIVIFLVLSIWISLWTTPHSEAAHRIIIIDHDLYKGFPHGTNVREEFNHKAWFGVNERDVATYQAPRGVNAITMETGPVLKYYLNSIELLNFGNIETLLSIRKSASRKQRTDVVNALNRSWLREKSFRRISDAANDRIVADYICQINAIGYWAPRFGKFHEEIMICQPDLYLGIGIPKESFQRIDENTTPRRIVNW